MENSLSPFHLLSFRTEEQTALKNPLLFRVCVNSAEVKFVVDIVQYVGTYELTLNLNKLEFISLGTE